MKNTYTVCPKCGTYIYKVKTPYVYWTCDCMDTLEPRKKVLTRKL